MARILSDGVNADYNDPDLRGYTHPIEPIIAMEAQSGPGIPLSVSDAMKRSDYYGAHGWQESLKKEIARVE